MELGSGLRGRMWRFLMYDDDDLVFWGLPLVGGKGKQMFGCDVRKGWI